MRVAIVVLVVYYGYYFTTTDTTDASITIAIPTPTLDGHMNEKQPRTAIKGKLNVNIAVERPPSLRINQTMNHCIALDMRKQMDLANT